MTNCQQGLEEVYGHFVKLFVCMSEKSGTGNVKYIKGFQLKFADRRALGKWLHETIWKFSVDPGVLLCRMEDTWMDWNFGQYFRYYPWFYFITVKQCLKRILHPQNDCHLNVTRGSFRYTLYFQYTWWKSPLNPKFWSILLLKRQINQQKWPFWGRRSQVSLISLISLNKPHMPNIMIYAQSIEWLDLASSTGVGWWWVLCHRWSLLLLFSSCVCWGLSTADPADPIWHMSPVKLHLLVWVYPPNPL